MLSRFAMSQYKLEITVINLNSNNGTINLELLDENQKSVTAKKSVINNKRCIITIEDLKAAKYAIRYIHDENANDKLDTNWMGMPTEGYGFSNNAYGSFGPQSFDKWLFTIKSDTKITLKTKY